MTESELIISASRGEMSALDALYQLYWADLVSYASLIVGEETAKDIVHDTFVRLWAGREGIHHVPTLRPYLMKSVYNAAVNVLRRNARQDWLDRYTDSQIDFLTAGTYDPDKSDVIRHLWSEESEAAIRAAVSQLPDRCREIFVLSYIEGLPHKEIAERLSISLSTVDNQIYKALKTLRSALKKIEKN